MTKSYRTRLYELALTNNGVITTELATKNGIPAVELRKLAARGAITRRAQGVYLSPFYPDDGTTRFRVALEVAGEGSFLFGSSVLSLLGITEYDSEPVRVGTTRRIRKAMPSSIEVKTLSQAPAIEMILGMPCQSPLQVLDAQKTVLTPSAYADLGMRLRRLGW
jgi:predicted transcriptional regulator of viral defense system